MAEIKSLEGLHILKIPSGGLRFELDPLFDPDFIDSVGPRAYDMVGNVEGFELVEVGNPKRSDFRCVQYVFARNKREPWAKEDERIEIFKDPVNFLTTVGYTPLRIGEHPANGDIIAYGTVQNGAPLFELGHMGVLDKDKVVSKFNEGHVFRHPIAGIPHHFGSQALFFRK